MTWLRKLNFTAHGQTPCTMGSLYVGGGTPNLLAGRQFEEVIAIAHRLFPHASESVERTIEGIPQLFSPVRVADLASAGFNRVSMGVQQIDDRLIRWSGRKQTRRKVFDAIACFHRHGLAFNVDLIFGWPEQTPQDVLRDLDAQPSDRRGP